MVELKTVIPNIVYDLRYASYNNFMQHPMYKLGTSVAYMRKEAAKALQQAQEELNKEGLGFKIFDAYRPWSVSKKFWDLVQDERYVANPARGSNHNRGIAVDLTIISLQTGKELDMGTGFDHFSDTAHHSFTQLPEPVLQNRHLLKTVMERNGFTSYNEEWWHYSFTTSVLFEVLDIPFKRLRK